MWRYHVFAQDLSWYFIPICKQSWQNKHSEWTHDHALYSGYSIDEIDNQWQSISINWLIFIIDDQSMAKTRVVIDWYRLIDWFSNHRFPSIEYPGWNGKARMGKWVIRVHVQRGISFALRRLGRNCFTNFIPRASGSIRSPSQVAWVMSVQGCCASW